MAKQAVTAFVAFLAVAGCGADEQPTSDKVVATQNPEKLPDWLTPNDKIDPAVWLRSREIGHKVADSDAEVGRIRRAISQATIRFYEDPRMLANRTAQTGTMLAEAGSQERYVDIMTGLIDIADASPVKKLYGQMCQHYLNNRKSGMDRSATIRQLTNAYKNAAFEAPKGKTPN